MYILLLDFMHCGMFKLWRCWPTLYNIPLHVLSYIWGDVKMYYILLATNVQEYSASFALAGLSERPAPVPAPSYHISFHHLQDFVVHTRGQAEHLQQEAPRDQCEVSLVLPHTQDVSHSPSILQQQDRGFGQTLRDSQGQLWQSPR